WFSPRFWSGLVRWRLTSPRQKRREVLPSKYRFVAIHLDGSFTTRGHSQKGAVCDSNRSIAGVRPRTKRDEIYRRSILDSSDDALWLDYRNRQRRRPPRKIRMGRPVSSCGYLCMCGAGNRISRKGGATTRAKKQSTATALSVQSNHQTRSQPTH